MPDDPAAQEGRKFALYAVRKETPGALIQINLPWERLMDDIVFPFEEGEMFFVDGAAVKSTGLDRLKILLQGPEFDRHFLGLHWSLRTASAQSKDIYARQYPVLFEGILRECCEDVTSQVIKAYKTAIKPSIKDYLPNKDQLLEASVKIFIEGMKLLHRP